MKQKKTFHKRNKKELSPLYRYLKETQRERRQEYESFLEYQSKKLQIPTEVLGGESIIKIEGTRQMILCGDYSIREYLPEQIVLQVKKRTVTVMGRHLTMEYLRNDEVKVAGQIQNIAFQRQEHLTC